MDQDQRFELLTCMPEIDARRLADRLVRPAAGAPAPDVAVLVPPTVGMLMARAVDGARGEHFNLAEVVVTEARVSVGGHQGWGMVMGRRPEHALAMAILDAVAEADPTARATIEREGGAAARAQQGQLAQEWARLAPTKVDLENF